MKHLFESGLVVRGFADYSDAHAQHPSNNRMERTVLNVLALAKRMNTGSAILRLAAHPWR